MVLVHIRFPRWVTTSKLKALKVLGHLKVLWGKWDLRTFVLISLGLQTLLILLAPFRKQTANTFIIICIWLAYLLADYVAIQAVGLIPNHTARSKNETDPAAPYTTHSDLLAFWSSFLLVHLGGPDTITALALEDNELWMRTALHLGTQVSATGRVFFQSLDTNLLWLPMSLMFLAGILKYLERTLSLFYARLTKFKSSMLTDPDPGPNYAKLMESYDSYVDSKLPTKFETNPEPDQYNFAHYAVDEIQIVDEDEEENNNGKKWTWLRSCLEKFRRKKKRELNNVQLVREAFEYFDKYKGLYVDLIFSFHDRNKSRTNFLKLTPEKAFTVLEIELNFTYEVFFTKMVVIHQTFGTIIRSISVVCETFSLLIWILFIDKKLFAALDIRITYTLLGGAIVLDAISVLRVVLSDWKIAMLSRESETRAYLYDKLLSCRNRTWGKYGESKYSGYGPWFRRIFFRRWSESVLQFNLLNYCVDEWSDRAKLLFKIVPFQDKFDGLVYVSKKWFADDLRNFLFYELKYKSEIADDAKDAEEICDSTGDWILRSLADVDFDTFKLYPWTADVEYDECLLLWHIATELLYQAEKEDTKDSNSVGKKPGEKEYREYCKILSDYMMYLLNRQPVMMFAVAGISEVRFRDTCAEVTKFLHRVLPKATQNETKEHRHQEACKRILNVTTKTDPREIKGDRSKSVLFDACRLAQELKKLPKGKRVGMWELMAKVWVELVCYSAIHCRANAHAAQLKQGGELLTLVWLLMVHLGLGKQFRITQGNARSKLIIGK